MRRLELNDNRNKSTETPRLTVYVSMSSIRDGRVTICSELLSPIEWNGQIDALIENLEALRKAGISKFRFHDRVWGRQKRKAASN